MIFYPISFFRNQTYWKIRQLQMRRINTQRKKIRKKVRNQKAYCYKFRLAAHMAVILQLTFTDAPYS